LIYSDVVDHSPVMAWMKPIRMGLPPWACAAVCPSNGRPAIRASALLLLITLPMAMSSRSKGFSVRNRFHVSQDVYIVDRLKGIRRAIAAEYTRRVRVGGLRDSPNSDRVAGWVMVRVGKDWTG
jgi:hypothetical protein